VPIVAVSGAVVTCNKARMSLWLLTYNNRHGRLHGVFIIEAASLLSARMGAADSALDEGASFAEVRNFDAARSARIPPGYVGMMLSRKEAPGFSTELVAKGGRIKGLIYQAPPACAADPACVAATPGKKPGIG
jgi:hypothetical protein